MIQILVSDQVFCWIHRRIHKQKLHFQTYHIVLILLAGSNLWVEGKVEYLFWVFWNVAVTVPWVSHQVMCIRLRNPFLHSTIKTDLCDIVSLCFKGHRTGHNTESKKSWDPPASCIQLTWDSDKATWSLLPWVSAQALRAESISPYNHQTVSHLPEGQFLGVLLSQMFHECLVGVGLSSLIPIVFILLDPVLGCRRNGLQGRLSRSLTSSYRTSSCSDHSYILLPPCQCLHI